MTLSEKICQDINRKFYFDDFVLNNLYYWKDGIKMEICDGLIEFDGIYLIIQIKERNENDDSNNEKWIQQKVYKKAVSQIKNTIAIIKTIPNLIVEDMYGQKVEINPNNQILPIIIFKNDNLNDYRKVYHSRSLDFNINIFSLKDYSKMMNVLEMPIDIVNYLNIRMEMFQYGNFNILIDEMSDVWNSFANVENEQDIASCFLFKYVNNKEYNYSAIKDYLGIIQKYHSRSLNENNKYKQILYRMLRLDRFGADCFIQRWIKSWEFAQKGILNFSQHIVCKNCEETFGFLFVSSKKNIKEDCKGFYLYLSNLFVQQYSLDTAITLVCYYEGDEHYLVNWMMMSKPFENDTELQNILKKNNPWKHIKNFDSN